MTGSTVRYTEEELDIARSTDLPDLLTSLGYQVKRVGSYYTTKEMDSLRIKNRRPFQRKRRSPLPSRRRTAITAA